MFPTLAHQAELEKHQGHIRLDTNFPFHGTHGRLTYDLLDKHWVPNIGKNDPSNCKADTKNKDYQEILFFDWKIQLEKLQLTRDLKDDTILYQGIRLPCKNDQGFLRSYNTNTSNHFQVAMIHARMVKFHQKYFIESIPFKEVNLDQIRNNNTNFRNLHNIENKLTRFQIYPETELACKYKKPIYKTQYSKILVEYEHGFIMNTGHLIVDPMATSHSLTDGNTYVSVKFQKKLGRIGEKLKPQDADSTRLQELSLMNRTYFGATHYDIHLDMKLDYTINRVFQEMSLSELETLHQLCELERT